ncbi:MAG: ribonuclease G [Gammaproteobacteria bacterium]|nr:ribonuclease G [Gammaproteobacteria bacterium]
MSQEILINVTPQETRVAILEQGVLQEVIIERANRRGLVGNIYKGRVVRVMPGMDAAFVDIGIDKAAFLHVSDILQVGGEYEDVSPDQLVCAQISELLKEGEELLVQVVKDSLGSKGARLTTQITIPSRYLVLMPNVQTVGVSNKIEDEEEKIRLRNLVTTVAQENKSCGYIVRTVAEGASEDAFRRDAAFLQKIWKSVEERAGEASVTEMVHHDLPLLLRTLRDYVDDDIERVLIDSKEDAERMQRFAQKYVPDVASRVEHYQGERPIFDLHNIEDEIQKALQRDVQLKSGGYLMIDQTEAMTTIDVNTGGFVGHRNLEETIYKTNLEAAQAIARQLRLRNLGGIIIIDFIDMLDEEHKRQVMRALNKALDKDYARTHVSEVSELGLVEMTRKRTRESLEHVLCQTCPSCAGRGSVRTAESVCYEIFREIRRVSRLYTARELTVLASSDVIDLLLDEQTSGLAELQSHTRATIRLQVENMYAREQYDVVIT